MCNSNSNVCKYSFIVTLIGILYFATSMQYYNIGDHIVMFTMFLQHFGAIWGIKCASVERVN